jgi:hypothetical protein
MRTLFDQLNDAYAKFYYLSEQLGVDEVTVIFKGILIFKHYILKNINALV